MSRIVIVILIYHHHKPTDPMVLYQELIALKYIYACSYIGLGNRDYGRRGSPC
jgi:hypothetical protein